VAKDQQDNGKGQVFQQLIKPGLDQSCQLSCTWFSPRATVTDEDGLLVTVHSSTNVKVSFLMGVVRLESAADGEDSGPLESQAAL